MKYSGSEYTITANDESAINRRINDLIAVTGTDYAVHPVLVTPVGLLENAHAGVIQAVVTAEDLFK